MSVPLRINNNHNNGNGNGNGTQACAACKHHRRKCAPDCILAPYFPHDRQRQFLNCHKLFGVKNITNIIRNLHPPHKDHAMRTIIFQSDVRAADPVGGCYRIIRDLQRQIDYTKAELDLVLQQLVIYRAAAAAHDHHHHQHSNIPESPSSLSVSMSMFVDAATDPLSSYYHHNYVLQQQYNHNQDINAWLMRDVHSLHVKDDGGFVDVDDIKPLLDIHADADGDDGVDDVDHTRFVADGDDGVDDVDHTSDEVILKEGRGMLKEENDSIRHAQDHDLKGAATLFTLTNCNA